MSLNGSAGQGDPFEAPPIAQYSLLGEFLVQNIAQNSLLDQLATLRDVVKGQGLVLNRLSESIATTYMTELEHTQRSPATLRAELVRRLLAGGPVDSAGLGYNLDATHIGIIASGAEAAGAVRTIATRLDCQLLAVTREQTMWAWLGSNRRLEVTDIESLLTAKEYASISLAFGESANGIMGWHLTHRQAQAAYRIALLRPQRLTWHSDVALEAFAMQDEAIARSFMASYLSPLDGRRCSGAVLRRTLLHYFTAARNATTAAINLNISRRTMRNHMAIIEEALGPLLNTRQAELELALRLDVLLEG